MRIIVRGNTNYQKIVSLPKEINRCLFIPSRYLLRQSTEEGTLLCNTLSGELVLLDPEEEQAFAEDPVSVSQNIMELIRHRFLVPQDICEDRTVDQLRDLMLKRREAKGTISNYSILPTTFCNARCFYCFENDIKQVHMSEETAAQLVDFIAKHHGESDVRLSWFGGEPLIGKQRIDQICRGLDARGIAFSSKMTSNGYLFDEELVRQARENWKLERVQITLDGTEEMYNRVKSYINPGASPYQRVLRNISLLAEAGIHVSIRLNLDNHNEQNLADLIRELSDRYRNRNHISVYFSILNEEKGFAPIHHSTEDRERLRIMAVQLWDLLKKEGWPVFKAYELPRMENGFCIANNPHSVQCTPDGIFSKCLGSIYENTVGNLTEGVTDKEKIKWWQQRTPFEGCDSCPLYPSCVQMLSHCPSRTECVAEERKRRIDGYRELMLAKYKEWKADKNGEESELL